jgi:hypothetical protein
MTIAGITGNLYDAADAATYGATIPAGSGNTASPDNVEVKDDWNEFGVEDACATTLTDITTSGRISQTLQGIRECPLTATETYTVASAAFVGCTLTSNGDSTFPPADDNITASISPGDGVVTITLPGSQLQSVDGVTYSASWQLHFPRVSVALHRSECAHPF